MYLIIKSHSGDYGIFDSVCVDWAKREISNLSSQNIKDRRFNGGLVFVYCGAKERAKAEGLTIFVICITMIKNKTNA